MRRFFRDERVCPGSGSAAVPFPDLVADSCKCRLQDNRVDRSTALMISAWQGAKNIPSETEWTKDMWDKLYDAVPPREHMAARRAEMLDPRVPPMPLAQASAIFFASLPGFW